MGDVLDHLAPGSLLPGGNTAGRTNTLSPQVFTAVSTGEFPRTALLCAVLAIISLLLYLGAVPCYRLVSKSVFSG